MTKRNNWEHNENLTLICKTIIDNKADAYIIDKSEVAIVVEDMVIKLFSIDKIKEKLQTK